MDEVLKFIAFSYLGFGIGYNVSMFNGGENLYWRANNSPPPGKLVSEIGVAIFIPLMTLLWPLYFLKKFTKKFTIQTGRD